MTGTAGRCDLIEEHEQTLKSRRMADNRGVSAALPAVGLGLAAGRSAAGGRRGDAAPGAAGARVRAIGGRCRGLCTGAPEDVAVRSARSRVDAGGCGPLSCSGAAGAFCARLDWRAYAGGALFPGAGFCGGCGAVCGARRADAERPQTACCAGSGGRNIPHLSGGYAGVDRRGRWMVRSRGRCIVHCGGQLSSRVSGP